MDVKAFEEVIRVMFAVLPSAYEGVRSTASVAPSSLTEHLLAEALSIAEGRALTAQEMSAIAVVVREVAALPAPQTAASA